MHTPESLMQTRGQRSSTRGCCSNVKCAPAGDAESESRSNWGRAHGRRWCKEPHAEALAEILGRCTSRYRCCRHKCSTREHVVVVALSSVRLLAMQRWKVIPTGRGHTVDAGAKSHTREHSLRSSVGAQAGVIGAGAWTALEPTWSLSQRQVCARWRCRVGKSFQLGAGAR